MDASDLEKFRVHTAGLYSEYLKINFIKFKYQVQVDFHMREFRIKICAHESGHTANLE